MDQAIFVPRNNTFSFGRTRLRVYLTSICSFTNFPWLRFILGSFGFLFLISSPDTLSCPSFFINYIIYISRARTLASKIKSESLNTNYLSFNQIKFNHILLELIANLSAKLVLSIPSFRFLVLSRWRDSPKPKNPFLMDGEKLYK
jgi:hypothetical protein